MFETLENRRMLSVTAVLNGETLMINGDNCANNIQLVFAKEEVSGALVDGGGDQVAFNISVKVSGQIIGRFEGEDVDAIVANLKGGNDTFIVVGNACRTPMIVDGGDGKDIISTGNGDDLITGGTCDDTLYGNNGEDVLYGGAGNDTLDGGDNNDMLYGQGGCDTMYGGRGDDFFSGGAGQDQAFGDGGINSTDGTVEFMFV